VTLTWVPTEQLPLLRRLAYALPRATIAEARVATTARGALVHCASGVDGIPLGTFFVEVAPRVFVPAGHEVVPAVSPEVLVHSLGVEPVARLLLDPDGRVTAIDDGAFVPLELALLESPPWERPTAEAIEGSLDEPTIDLSVASIGLLPVRGVEPRGPR
jgi:hypothetical protein